MYWINFLHLYQPPNQPPSILKKVAQDSYSLIASLIERYPGFRPTINISGSLLEQIDTPFYSDILAKFKDAVASGKIELVGSAMYHPILSLLPKEEIKRQIILNDKINKKIFGSSYNPRGFYIPEMAYSKEVGDVIKEMGFEWIMLDEAHFGEKVPDPKTKYIIPDNGLFAVFRDRKLSRTFPPQSIVENLESEKNGYIITAHDGELYGHWHRDDKGYYEKAFTNPNIKIITVSEYLNMVSEVKKVTPRKTNWEATANDMKYGIRFALWNHPENKIHRQLWGLANLAINLIENNKEDPNFESARKHLDKGLSSCSWWWASEMKPINTSPVTWNPDVIQAGLFELITSIRSLKKASSQKKISAEKAYAELLFAVWKNHWEKYS